MNKGFHLPQKYLGIRELPLFATAEDGQFQCPKCHGKQMWNGKRETFCGWCQRDVTVTQGV